MQISQMPVTQAQGRHAKIHELDFVRAVCAIGVIVYHVSCYASSDAPKFFRGLADNTVDPGTFLVGAFLMISGGVLYYNHREIPSLRIFYYKRWRSLYPMFYVSYLYFYINNVIETGRLFFLGKPFSMVLSVLGMDGYFLYKGTNYYHVGEWFFGAIVLLYIMYPLFAKLLNRYGAKGLIVLIPVWLWQIYTDVFDILVGRNLIYCSGIFIVGMLVFKYELYRNKLLKWISVPISLILILVPITRLYHIKHIILTISVFFSLFAIAEVLIKIPGTHSVIKFLGDLSFPMYLVQNQIGVMIVRRFNPVSMMAMVKVSVVTVGLCVLAGWCLKAVTNALLKTNWFCGLERVILKNKVEV